MGAWQGQILRVNLTKGTCKKEKLDPKLARAYIGGRGLGTKMLFDEVSPAVDPLSPNNKLIIAPGWVTGTPAAPSSGRIHKNGAQAMHSISTPTSASEAPRSRFCVRVA